jgi:caffeoyl-CoA O-methyltransferase
MSASTIVVTPELRSYLLQNSLRDTDLLARLREETQALPMGRMQICPEQGQFMALLMELLGARKTLEVGTFTGYSALVVALALPPDGRVVACDVSEEWTRIARRYWEEAGVAHKIDLHLGPGVDTLQALIDEGGVGTFDFVFLDADKVSYPTYYEQAVQLLRPGGLLAVDNALWGGRVADPTVTDDDTEGIRRITRTIHSDPRVTPSLLPLGDGLLLARRR